MGLAHFGAYLSILPFLHTPAEQHHLTGRENTVLTNREMAASCTDRAGQGGDTLCLQLFIRYEEKGEVWGEHGGEEGKEKNTHVARFTDHN